MAAAAAVALALVAAVPASAAAAPDTTPDTAVAANQGLVRVQEPSSGCGKAPTLTSGTRTIQSGNTNRSYILRIPDNYDNTHPYKLIFGFHWLGGTANDVATGNLRPGGGWAFYGLQALANNSAIVVAPQGLNNGWPNTGQVDTAFTDAMLEEIQNDLCVDSTQIFSTGFSYGGGMSYALACARPQVFRAVAVLAGGLISGCQGGTEPVAYLGIHGISDNVLPISLGRMLRDTFVRNNGCTAQQAPEPTQGSGTHTTTHFTGCAEGYPVSWYAFDGGHTPIPPDDGATWAPAETWKFFSQFESVPAPPEEG